MTPASVGAYYDRLTELVGGGLGGSFHIGYWAGLPPGSSVEDASRRMTELMIGKLGARPGQRVLDVGCGTGRPAVELARASGAEVVGVNVSRRQVEWAARLAAREGLDGRVRFLLADAMDLPFRPRSFDGAWLFESLFHMPDPARVLRRVAELLRPGGILVIANLVQRSPLTDEQNAGLRTCWETGRVAAVLPLADHPALVAAGGLVLRELTDVSEHTVRPTFRALRAEHAARAAAVAPSGGGAPPGGVAPPGGPSGIEPGIDEGMARFAATPEVGFAVVVAAKPP
ncbi:class I SAM-dependent methyltransferase [Streptomyces sp. TRM70308]|uniref:SAM-dependent methyltransferase n=1 Tax=Streptomyces sp. TRM70308 TaxID=3131932 RepID=UPI003D061E70